MVETLVCDNLKQKLMNSISVDKTLVYDQKLT